MSAETPIAVRPSARPRFRLTRRAALGAVTAVFAAPPRAAAARATEEEEDAASLAARQSSTSLIVTRDGRIVTEWYAPGWNAERPREVASVAKSLLSVLIGMALEDGAFSGLDQPAADFIPAWGADGRQAITLRHLMSMTSGLDDRGLALRGVAGDQFLINAAAPLRDPPGARWAYNTAAYHLLFHILERATGRRVADFASDRLIGPLGMVHTTWITSQGDGAGGPVTNYYSAASTARDLARFGSMVLNGGVWQDRRLIARSTLDTLTQPSQPLNPSYGLLWWSNARAGFDALGQGDGVRFPSAPRDTVAALGAGGQMVLIAPSRRLVLVRQGNSPPSAKLADELLATVLQAG